MNRFSPVLWGLLILPLQAGIQEKSTGSRFCDFNQHKYFNHQVPRCKRCDKCHIGLGLVSITDEAIRLDPIHGAMSCQRCVECVAGKDFSNNISYQPCKPCKNCTSLGMEERERCTPLSDTRCQKKTPPLERKTNVSCNTTSKQSHGSDVTEKNESNVKWIIALLVVVIVLMICAPCALQWYCERKGQLHRYFVRAKKKLKPAGNRTPRPMTDQQPFVSQDGPLNERAFFSPAALLVKDEDYFQLGLRLGIASHDIDIINADCYGNAKKKSFEVLNKWRKMLGKDATRGLFYGALRHIKRADVIAKMEQERKTDNDEGDHTGESPC